MIRYSIFPSLALLSVCAISFGQVTPKLQERLEKEVKHELRLLPYFTVFDNLAFRVDGDRVTLLGQVVDPVLKADAQRVVERIEGVSSVDNRIEVLPVSPNDDRIRRAVYRAIYGTPGLDTYALRAVPTIHILVKNGNLTLIGAVGNKMDRDRAGIIANGVPGVFKVTNDLIVDAR